MSNLSDCLQSEYSGDIAKIREATPLLFRFSDLEIERLWDRFSDSRCAGWLMVYDETLRDFQDWIKE